MSVLTKSRVAMLSLDQSDFWMETLEEIGVYDTYHLPTYHRLAEIRGEGDAIMLIYREGRHIIAFPMLLRNIPLTAALNVGYGLKDTTSVYGYGGPIANGDVPDDVKDRFAQAVDDFYKNFHIVCAFSRLHPIIGNHRLLEGYGQLTEVGAVISIDLTTSPEEQYARYRRNHKKGIGHLRECGLICDEVGKDGLDDFMQIYYETMDRKEAEPYYYFDRQYFDYLLTEMSEVTHLFLTRKDRTAVSCCIAFTCNGFVQGHLGGTLTSCLPLAPMKMTLDYIRRWANGKGYHTYNIGGGVGGKKDSLFMFKQGFSKQENPLYSWRHVVDKAVYDDLSREIISFTGKEPTGEYFPIYRDPVFQQ